MRTGQSRYGGAPLVGFPGLVTGTATVNETSRLLGAGGLYRQDIGALGEQRISALIGYRYLHSSDRLSMPVTANFGGGAITDADAFRAATNFHGVDLGLTGEWKRGLWSLEWRSKVALGANVTNGDISGTTAITVGGVTTTSAGGFLALPSNIGSTSQTRLLSVRRGRFSGACGTQGWPLESRLSRCAMFSPGIRQGRLQFVHQLKAYLPCRAPVPARIAFCGA